MADKYLDFFSNEEEFRKALERDAGLLISIAERGITNIAERFPTELKREHFTGYYNGNTRGDKLRIRKGHLRQSAGGHVISRGTPNVRAVLRVGGRFAFYARTQEYGLISKPRSAKYLRIPIYPEGGKGQQADRPALTPTGRLRSKAIPRRVGGRWVTGYGPTSVIRSKKGNLLVIARAVGNQRKPRARYGGNKLLFVLKKSVRIKPRLNAGERVSKIADQELDKIEARFTRVLTR